MWLALIDKGIDPKIEEARQVAAARRQQSNTFAAVAAEFSSTEHASGLRKAKEARRIVDEEFVKRWRARPVTDIRPEEAAAGSGPS